MMCEWIMSSFANVSALGGGVSGVGCPGAQWLQGVPFLFADWQKNAMC